MGMVKLTLRQIRKSMGRFLAVLAIVALGVGLFCGLRLTKTAMIHTLDVYTHGQAFYDYRLVCTLGFAEQDVATVQREPGVAQAEGARWADALCTAGDGPVQALHGMSVPSQVNLLELKAGRLPQSADECVLDAYHFDKDLIGKTLRLTQDNDEAALDAYQTDTFTVVGLVSSPLYINFERGSTTVGSGTLAGFFCVLPEAFTMDYYTDIYLRLEDGQEKVYSAAYDEAVAAAEPAMKRLGQTLAASRDESVRIDVRKELDDARATIEEKTQELVDGEQTLLAAGQELKDGWASYYDGWAELADGRQQAARELESARRTLLDAETELEENRALLAQKQQELDEARKTISSGQQQLDEAWAQYEEGHAAFRAASGQADAQITEAYEQLNEAQEQLDAAQREINENKLKLALGVLSGQVTPEQLAGAQAQLDEAQAQLDAGQAQLEAGRSQLVNQQFGAQEQLHAASMTLSDARRQLLEKQAELDDAAQQVSSGAQQLEDGKREWEDGARQLQNGWAEYHQAQRDTEQELADSEQALLDARQTLLDGEQELTDGRRELEDGKRRLESARQELLDGERELDALEAAQCYVLDRSTNTGYVCFESDSDIVQGISRVFPVFFFLVAALVCITTMTRMVEEQRTQTGVLKALGYSDGAIAASYLFYTASASVLGCVVGIVAGTYLLPKIIWNAYNTMYGFSDILWAFDWGLAIGVSAAYLACALLATWYACASELTKPAAELIRPKAPKAGKRILLERVPLIWNRVKFLHKVSIRNILRYKKRMFMMIIGIGGCTALLLTGFGISDSIQNVMDYQFDEIAVYDASARFKDGMGEDARRAFSAEYDAILAGSCFVAQENMTCTAGGTSRQASTVVAESGSTEGYFDLHLDGEAVSYPTDGTCAISQALAKALSVAVGDTITLSDSEYHGMSLRVSGIFENYVSNYVFVNAATWLAQMQRAPVYKEAWLLLDTAVDAHAAAAELSGDGAVMNVSVNQDIYDRIVVMLDSLNAIVLMIILFAGTLAFVVLYNLTNINITERAREIATVKVLGFYDPETDRYVFRENFVLTLSGVLVGLPMGIGLHAYVMSQIKLDMISFDIRIAPVSFVYAALLTVVFNLLVSMILRIKLRRIDMAQALKSIE